MTEWKKAPQRHPERQKRRIHFSWQPEAPDSKHVCGPLPTALSRRWSLSAWPDRGGALDPFYSGKICRREQKDRQRVDPFDLRADARAPLSHATSLPCALGTVRTIQER